MAARGCLIGVTREQVTHLVSLGRTQDKAEYLDSLIEDDNWQDLDKAWYALHRCLSNYPRDVEPLRPDLTDQHGSYPLKIAIYGGGDINDDSDSNWLIFLKDAKQVMDLSAAMDSIDETWLSERYWSTSSEEIFPEYGEEDREYTWEYFVAARDFLKRMAAEGCSVVFLADQ